MTTTLTFYKSLRPFQNVKECVDLYFDGMTGHYHVTRKLGLFTFTYECVFRRTYIFVVSVLDLRRVGKKSSSYLFADPHPPYDESLLFLVCTLLNTLRGPSIRLSFTKMSHIGVPIWYVLK